MKDTRNTIHPSEQNTKWKVKNNFLELRNLFWPKLEQNLWAFSRQVSKSRDLTFSTGMNVCDKKAIICHKKGPFFAKARVDLIMFQMSKDFWSKKNCFLRWFRHFTYLSMNIYEYQSWILKNVEKQDRKGFRFLSARYPVW